MESVGKHDKTKILNAEMFPTAEAAMGKSSRCRYSTK